MDFVELPPRSIKAYYRIIAQPMSLKKLQSLVRGTAGRVNTAVSEFKSWDELESVGSLLWRNAFQFNEDDSDIFLIGKDLEVSWWQYLFFSFSFFFFRGRVEGVHLFPHLHSCSFSVFFLSVTALY